MCKLSSMAQFCVKSITFRLFKSLSQTGTQCICKRLWRLAATWLKPMQQSRININQTNKMKGNSRGNVPYCAIIRSNNLFNDIHNGYSTRNMCIQCKLHPDMIRMLVWWYNGKWFLIEIGFILDTCRILFNWRWRYSISLSQHTYINIKTHHVWKPITMPYKDKQTLFGIEKKHTHTGVHKLTMRVYVMVVICVCVCVVQTTHLHSGHLKR